MFVRAGFPFNYDALKATDETGIDCGDETKTQQQFAEEVNINTIVRQFGLTGKMPDDVRMPVSGDFSDAVVDYQTALNLVIAADDAFMSIPADVRYRFHHNPQELMDFLENPANRDEGLKLGLLKPPPEKTRDVVTAVDDLSNRLTPIISQSAGDVK